MLAELRRCGLTDSETCLKGLTLSLGWSQTVSVEMGLGCLAPRRLPEPLTLAWTRCACFSRAF